VVTVVTILAWALVAGMVAVALLQLLAVLVRQRSGQPPVPPDRLTRDVLIGLYGIRQRLSVRQYRTAVKREGAKARRSMRAELERWEEWEQE
jgi:hypothetical protein